MGEGWEGVIAPIRDAAFKKRARRFANYTVAVLSLLFKWAAVREFMPTNVGKRSVKDACRRSSVGAMMGHGGDGKGSVHYRVGGH